MCPKSNYFLRSIVNKCGQTYKQGINKQDVRLGKSHLELLLIFVNYIIENWMLSVDGSKMYSCCDRLDL